MKKWIIFIALVVFLGGAGLFIYQKVQDEQERLSSEKPDLVDVARKRTIVSIVQATGFVQPIQATEVKAEINGRLLKIHVANNDVVKEGQLIAELDPVLATTKKDEAERTYESQKLTLEKAKRDYDRQVQLRQKNYTTEKEYEDAKTTYEIAEIQLSVMKARLDEAKENLAKTYIRAPHDGVVSDLNVTEGQVIVGAGSVSSGTTIMKINDLSRMYVDTDVNEIDINRIHPESVADITFDSLPDVHFEGAITEISGTAVSRNSLRVFPVKIVFDVGGRRVYPGITAGVSIPVSRAQDVVSVIISAVFADGNSRFVFLQKTDGSFERRPVVTGISDASFVEIKQGLADGDVVSLVRPSNFQGMLEKRAARQNGGNRR